ncbi:MAG: flagellar motor protein MotD [Gallionellales bacterium RIFOXYB12_FULL_54_9]|nr:MAG: flagellar motor protein MotD [Gallionellales bacterium RIFOXYB12_FULL_54_9]
MARRVSKHEEHDNHERWLISYADFITLLFAFFVVMYSISSVNEGKYKTFGDSLSIAFSQQTGTSAINISQNQTGKIGIPQEGARNKVLVDKQTANLVEQKHKMQERMKGVEGSLHRVMAPLIAQGQVGVHQTKRGVAIDISASTLFKEGEVRLQPGALESLQQVAQVLSKENLAIEVEGHTDDVPIKNIQFPSNWELSSGRASTVVRMLVTYGVDEMHLAAVGMAANQPIEPNDTPEHRAKNRRVSITILSPEFDRLNPAGSLLEEPGAAPAINKP